MSEIELLSSTTTPSVNINQPEQAPVSETTQNTTKSEIHNLPKRTNLQKNKFIKWTQPLTMKNEPTWNEFNWNFNYQYQPVSNQVKNVGGQQLRPTATPFNPGFASLYNPNYSAPMPLNFSNQMNHTPNSFEFLQPPYTSRFSANFRPFVPKYKQRSKKIEKSPNSAESEDIVDKEDIKVSENSENEKKKDGNELPVTTTTTTTATVTTNTKTPMCLVHELVKYNKIKHEYVLLDEIGPAHKKTFYVALKLGVGTEQEETFSSNGSSIKKAQHAAAEIALKNTKFKRPESKSNRINTKLQNRTSDKLGTKETNENVGGLASANIGAKNKRISSKKSNTIAPTVLLNTLAMKLGMKANYVHITTKSFTTNVNDAQIEEGELVEPTEPSSSVSTSAFAQSSDVTLHSSFDDSSDNYINFNKTQHEPFKYPSSQIYLYPAYMQRFTNSSSFNTALSNHQLTYKNSKYESNFSKTGKMSKIRRFTLNQQQYQQNGDTNCDTNPLLCSKQFDVYKVELKFADCTFNGEGRTLQMAKHDAASKALSYFTDANNFLKAKELSDKIKLNQAKCNNKTQVSNKNNEAEVSSWCEEKENATKTIKAKETKTDQKLNETKSDGANKTVEQEQQQQQQQLQQQN